VNEETRVLVCDDEPQILRALRVILRDAGFGTIAATTGEEALDQAAVRPPAAAIIDLMLPDMDGVEVTKRLREWSEMPIIVLSAVGEEEAKVRALGAGADDYVTKPFNPGELRARVRAQLRRKRMGESAEGRNAVTVGELVIDAAKRTVKRGGKDVHLTPTEWELLRAFLRDPGKTLTHQQLFRAVWAASSGDPQQYLRVYVANLRRKLESDPVRPVLIITEPGVGYRFEAGA
jgi:two-component system KDP operon response regulator KdpE